LLLTSCAKLTTLPDCEPRRSTVDRQTAFISIMKVSYQDSPTAWMRFKLYLAIFENFERSPKSPLEREAYIKSIEQYMIDQTSEAN
jgi:hypothetical protein